MCGIAGMVGHPGEQVDATVVHNMCQTIIHRGPDDEGILVQGHVGLGMRRLSIIDLSGGHQPIHNEDCSVWVVFNGEIYNFPELRSELEARGHHFYTHSDTEVIVHLYEEKGADCVQDLRGMFAIALYDRQKDTLLLVRDRLGKKPLYYSEQDGRLYFGSEIKTMLAADPQLADPDPQGLLQFFYFGYIPYPYTSFRRIKKLPPGHLLEFHRGESRIRQYWDLPDYGTYDPGSDEACLEELQQRLEDAVRCRLISDVPLGALLSGGVDSSIVVATMSRVSPDPVKTFSIGFDNDEFNEAEYARLVAQSFGTDHHELTVDPDIAGTLEHLSGMLEEPFGDSSMIPTYHVSRLARQNVTVALSGDGGDELFAGYDRYMVSLQRQRYNFVPVWAGRLYRRHIYGLLPESVLGRKFAWNITLPPGDRYIDSVSFLPALHRERGLFSEEFLRQAHADHEPEQQFQQWYDRAPAKDLLSRLLYLDTKSYLVEDILTKVDRMSMATSLEMRAPILDHRFVEWVTSLPVHYKYRNGTRKYIFKKLAERLGIPAELLHRKKQGFALPLVHWMRNELKDLLSVLAEPQAEQRGYFNRTAVRQMFDEHMSGRRDRSSELWLLLVFELWHRNFLEAGRYVRQTKQQPLVVATAQGEGR